MNLYGKNYENFDDLFTYVLRNCSILESSLPMQQLTGHNIPESLNIQKRALRETNLIFWFSISW